MVKIKNSAPTGRATRRPGRMLTTLTKGGNFVAKSWPRKRGPIKSEAQAATAEQFALAQKAANEAFSWFWIEAENMAEGSIWNRREILVKAAQGTLMEIRLRNGEFYGNWFVLAREIQALLDTIISETGCILVRTPERWEALLPAANGYVLTSNGPDFIPSWQPGAAPADTWQWSNCQWIGAFSSSNICQGIDLWPACNVEINKIAFRVNVYAGATYGLTICKLLSNDRIDTILHTQDVTAPVFAASGAPVISLSQTVTLNERERYGVLISKTNGAAGTGLGLGLSRQLDVPIPTMNYSLIMRENLQNPAPGDLLFTTGDVCCFNFEWRQV